MAISLLMTLPMLFAGCLGTDIPPAPTAIIDAPEDGITGLPLNFSASNSTTNKGKITEYLWDFGDGRGKTGKDLQHSYEQAGIFVVRLVVINSKGGAHSVTHIIDILYPNTVPVAKIEGDLTGRVGQNLGFNGTGSVDTDEGHQKALAYQWNFGDGSSEVGKIVEHPYSEPGTYLVTLTVTDPRNASASDSIQVTITLRQYRVNWDIHQVHPIDDDSHLEAGENTTFVKTLPYNVTTIMANVTWTDDYDILPFQEDTFSLELIGQDGLNRLEQDNDGSIPIAFNNVNQEFSSTVYLEAYNMTDLYDRLINNLGYQGTSGQGDWQIIITMEEALPDVLPPLPDPDTGNDYHLDFDYIYYTARVTEVQD